MFSNCLLKPIRKNWPPVDRALVQLVIPTSGRVDRVDVDHWHWLVQHLGGLTKQKWIFQIWKGGLGTSYNVDKEQIVFNLGSGLDQFAGLLVKTSSFEEEPMDENSLKEAHHLTILRCFFYIIFSLIVITSGGKSVISSFWNLVTRFWQITLGKIFDFEIVIQLSRYCYFGRAKIKILALACKKSKHLSSAQPRWARVTSCLMAVKKPWTFPKWWNKKPQNCQRKTTHILGAMSGMSSDSCKAVLEQL